MWSNVWGIHQLAILERKIALASIVFGLLPYHIPMLSGQYLVILCARCSDSVRAAVWLAVRCHYVE